MNFAGSINAARETLHLSADIRHRYHFNPEQVLTELAGLNLESMRGDIDSARFFLTSKDRLVRTAAFLLLIDKWRAINSVDICVDFAFKDEDSYGRGFALERICMRTDFAKSDKVKHAILSIAEITITDDFVVQTSVDAWISAVSGYINAEHLKETLRDFEKKM